MPNDKRGEKEDERFGKARNDAPPDPYHDSTSIAKEPPRLDDARRAEEEEEAASSEDRGKHDRFERGEKPR